MITINVLTRKNSSTISIKRRNLFLLTSLLLAQTTAVWAMNDHDWNDVDKAAIRAAGLGQQDFKVKSRGFISFVPPEVNVLKPTDPLPAIWGYAQQKVSCEFANAVEVGDIILPTQYPLKGQWITQEDRDHTQTLATLKLTTFLNNQDWTVDEREPIKIKHDRVSQEEETFGDCWFREDTVFRTRSVLRRLKDPITGVEYPKNSELADADVHTHQGYQVIYVEPFALRGRPSKPKEEYCGKYSFGRALDNTEGLKGKEIENLFYSDGIDIYLPHVTQELWKQDNSETGFFIASIKRDRRLNFVGNPLIKGGQLPKGLYQLLSVHEASNGGNENPKRRTEKWQKLGEDQMVIEIRPLAGLSSIPGLGGYAPRVVLQAEGAETMTRLQRDIQRIKERTLDRAAIYENTPKKVVVIGRAGIGKSTLIEGLAGELVAERKGALGPLKLRAITPLPDFEAGNGVIGTTLPAAWYDKDHETVFWDCPGFNGPGGDEENLRNGIAIHQLFTPQSEVKILAAIPEEDLMDDRHVQLQQLFSRITELFPNDGQLQNSLSLIITKTTYDDDTLKEGLKEIKEKKLTFYNDRAKNLFNFLVDTPDRVTSFPVPRKVDAYKLDKEKIYNALGEGITKTENSAVYTLNFTAQPNLDPGAKNLIGDLAENFNHYLTNHMETETYQRIINHCIQKIDKCTASIGTLRTELKNLIEGLQQLPTHCEKGFVDGLKNIINVDDVKKIIDDINFLKNIKDKITCNIGSWKSALIDKIAEKFKNLTDEPKVEFVEATGILTLKGALIGMEDINKALRERPTTRELNVCALNTLFLDADLTKPGLSVSFIAPEWKINAPLTINLSGVPGENGPDGLNPRDHGKPGLCGKNGGHFLGLAYNIKQIHHLTVNTSGGKGGSGGKGVKGADGLKGDDAKLTDELILKDNIQPTTQLFNQKKVITIDINHVVSSGKKGKPHKQKEESYQTTREILFTKNFYKVSGKSGEVGKDGGQGGKGGFGGKPGEISMNIPLPPEKAISKPGGEGSNGEAGLGGKNGTHGENGEWSKEVEGKYEHNSQAKASNSKCKLELNRESIKSVADGKLTLVGHTPNNSAPVASGNKPEKLNEAGLEQPTPQVRLNSGPLVQAYNLYYQQQASNPDVAPIIKVFPNLQ